MALRLDFAALSDVGRVRKDNQDSGYVGPHLIAVCDGVGGAARGDIASSTAIAQLRKLDENPPAPDTPEKELLGQVSGALHRAHARIAASGDQWFVEDLGSTNGTYIGTVRITQPTTITLGTQVRIGKTILEMRK